MKKWSNYDVNEALILFVGFVTYLVNAKLQIIPVSADVSLMIVSAILIFLKMAYPRDN